MVIRCPPPSPLTPRAWDHAEGGEEDALAVKRSRDFLSLCQVQHVDIQRFALRLCQNCARFRRCAYLPDRIAATLEHAMEGLISGGRPIPEVCADREGAPMGEGIVSKFFVRCILADRYKIRHFQDSRPIPNPSREGPPAE